MGMLSMTKTDVFRAIADPNRRFMLDELLHKEMNVTELTNQMEMSQPAVSQHLKVLRDASLISVQQVGRNNVYSANPEQLKQVANWLQQYSVFWDTKISNLKNHLAKSVKKKK